MENQHLIKTKSCLLVYTWISATRFRSPESSSTPGIKQVRLHFNCKIITDNWVSDRQTSHRLEPHTEIQTKKITFPVIVKGVVNPTLFENATKELNSWLSPGANNTLSCTEEIMTYALDAAQAYSPPHNIEMHIDHKIVISREDIMFVRDVTEWVMQWSLEECAPRMVPASDSSIKSLRRTIVVDGDDDDDGGCESCSVCLEDILPGSKVSCLPCSHVYHQDCIGEWLRTSHYCPNCKYEMPTD